ncbi:hypothetical protein BC827DRAFT_1384049 [Russula dissimulans]|nr:hypothetical protein BC827DRAFT_1384049 [Russula dissimulans]
MLSTHIQDIDEAIRIIVLESLITDSVVYDEGSSSAHSLDPISRLAFPQTPPIATEVFGPLSVISNDNVAYTDAANYRQEGESFVPSEFDTPSTSEPSVLSIPSEIFDAPAAMPYQDPRTIRGQSRQFHKRKPGKESAIAPSRPSRQLTNARKAPKGPYLCNVCGKLFAQRQGLGRHRRETHDARMCKHCGKFKWGRLYLLRKHLKVQHPDIDADAALEEARGSGRMFRNNHTMSTHGICLRPLNTTEGTILNSSPFY